MHTLLIYKALNYANDRKKINGRWSNWFNVEFSKVISFKMLSTRSIPFTNHICIWFFRYKGFNSGGSQFGLASTKKLTTQSQPLMRPESLMTLSKKEGIALIEGSHPVQIKKSLLIRDYKGKENT